MSEYIAVDGLTISHSSGSAISGGEFTITSLPSLKSKVKGSGIYSGTLTFTFSGGNHTAGIAGTASGAGSINFTASKTKVDGKFVLRKGDSGTLSGTYTQVPPPSPPPTIPFSSNIEISDAGQTLVKAN